MDSIISVIRHCDCILAPKSLLNDKQITFFDKGLLLYLIQLQDIRVANIALEFGITERKVLKSMMRLIKAGYIERNPKWDGERLCGQQYTIKL